MFSHASLLPLIIYTLITKSLCLVYVDIRVGTNLEHIQTYRTFLPFLVVDDRLKPQAS